MFTNQVVIWISKGLTFMTIFIRFHYGKSLKYLIITRGIFVLWIHQVVVNSATLPYTETVSKSHYVCITTPLCREEDWKRKLVHLPKPKVSSWWWQSLRRNALFLYKFWFAWSHSLSYRFKYSYDHMRLPLSCKVDWICDKSMLRWS